MSRTIQLTFDAHDPETLSRFWADAMGYVNPPPPGRTLEPGQDPFEAWHAFLAEVGVPESEWNSASAAERQVAERVAHGLTSRAIAEELFVSPRTVDAHLTHIYRKLDINTRARLAALVMEQSHLAR